MLSGPSVTMDPMLIECNLLIPELYCEPIYVHRHDLEKLLKSSAR